MKPLPPMKRRPVVPLGKGATLYLEVRHFVHHTANQLAVLAMRMEIRAMTRKERQARKSKRRAA